MRVSQAEKEKSRERIVASAARLLRERGVEGASVADVMNDAGLTHGGFYRHFETKDAMVAAAIDHAFDQMISTAVGGAPEIAMARFIDTYLSEAHVAHPGQGCPIPALAGDVGRAPALVQDRFSAGLRRMAAAIGETMPGDDEASRVAAWRQLAMMVGAVAMARAADAPTSAEILAACSGTNLAPG